MTIDEHALAQSILQGSLDLLKIFIKVRGAGWTSMALNASSKSDTQGEKVPLLHLAISKFILLISLGSASLKVVEFVLSKGF